MVSKLLQKKELLRVETLTLCPVFIFVVSRKSLFSESLWETELENIPL